MTIKKLTFYQIILSLILSSCCFLSVIKADNKENTTDLKKPIITKVTFEENRQKAGFFMVIQGKNFKDNPETTIKLSVTTSDSKQLDVSSSIEQYYRDLIVARLNSEMKSGDIYLNKTVKEKGTIKSEPFFVKVNSPEISFILGKNGILPGEIIEIHGKNFSGSGSDLEITAGTLYGEVKKDLIKIRLAKKNLEANLQVISNGLLSNTIDLKKIFPPLLQNVYLRRNQEDEEEAVLIAKNIFMENEEVSKNIKVYFNDKTAKVNEVEEKDKSKIISVTLPRPLPSSAKVKMSIDGTESNTQIIKLESIHLSRISFIGKDNKKDVFKVSVNNFPPNIDKLSVVMGKITMPENDILYTNGKIRISTDKKIPSKGEVQVTIDNKFISNSLPYSLEEELDPIIYRVESRNGFHEGAIFTIYGTNLGTEIRKVTINGANIDKNFGFNGIRSSSKGLILSGSRIQSMFALPEDTTSIKLSDEPTTTLSLSINNDGKKSNVIKVPFGSTHPKIVTAIPVISRVEFPEGRNAGKKIIIWGKNFGTKKNHNILKFSSSELKIEKVNSRGTKIESILPMEAKSGNLSITATFPIEQDSKDFPIVISSAENAILSLQTIDLTAEEKKVTVDNNHKTVVLGKFNLKNSINDLKIGKFKLKLSLQEEDEESEFSLKNLQIPPFGEFYLKKGQEIIAGPAFAKLYSKNIFVDFSPAFDLPLTESAEGDEFSIEVVILPFITDNAKIKTSLNLAKENYFSAFNFDTRKNVTPQEEKIVFEEIQIKNELVKCINGNDKKDFCQYFLKVENVFDTKKSIKKTTSEKKVKKNQNTKKKIIKKTTSSKDQDGDGLSDKEEFFLKTNPQKKDTDSDGLDDFIEIEKGFSPLKKENKLIFSDLDENNSLTPYVIKLYLFGVLEKKEAKFFPQSTMTRFNFFQLASDALREEKLPKVKQNPFIDVPFLHPLSANILFAKKQKAIDENEKTFQGKAAINRIDFLQAIFAFKKITLTEKTSTFKTLSNKEFTLIKKAEEMDLAPEWFIEEKFAKNRKVKKGEAVEIIYKMIWL